MKQLRYKIRPRFGQHVFSDCLQLSAVPGNFDELVEIDRLVAFTLYIPRGKYGRLGHKAAAVLERDAHGIALAAPFEALTLRLEPKWSKIEPYLPTDVCGKPRVDDRRVISGKLHVLKTGCRWCDCPPEHGPHTTIYNRFVRCGNAVWERLFNELAQRGRAYETQMMDSTHVKAHRSASGG